MTTSVDTKSSLQLASSSLRNGGPVLVACLTIVKPRGWILGLAILSMGVVGGCSMSAPMAVMHPPRLNVAASSRPTNAPLRVAFAPIVAQEKLSREMEQALAQQLPIAPTQSQLINPDALASASPIRLASTAPLTSDLTAIHAARQAQADFLLIGEVLQEDLVDEGLTIDEFPPELNKYRSRGGLFLPPASARRPSRVALAWRVFDVPTGHVLGKQTISINRYEVDRRHPDLKLAMSSERERVIAASARETWRAVTPFLEKEDAVIALPWLQPGAAQIRRGNAYARQGRWDLAEAEWSIAAAKHPYSNSAKLNLALAQTAREDFSAAKQTLGTMGPLRLRRLQSETLVWIDQRHRWYHESLGLPPPDEGWAFPDATLIAQTPTTPSAAPDPEDAPWWTAIPFTKPPGWKWRKWLFQPWAL